VKSTFLIPNTDVHPSDPHFLAQKTAHAELPKEADVVIVGGGLLGCAVAYYLARAGVDVTLLERGELNREASGTNAGSFHFQIALHQLNATSTLQDETRLLDEVRLQLDAAALWDRLEDELGADLGVHTTGGLMVAETLVELQILRDKQRIESLAGLETQVMTGNEMREFAPYLAPDLRGIAFCAREGHANPLIVAPFFALRASEYGAEIRTNCSVSKIEVHIKSQSQRFTLHTSRGSIRCNRIVDAAGAWTSDLAALVDLRLPMALAGLHVNVTEPREYFLKPMVQHIGKRLTLKQTTNNSFIIGGGWPARREIFPKRYSNYWESAAGNIALAVRVLPMLKDVKLIRTWTGIWAYTTDFAPIVGESQRVPGFHVVMAPTGFTLGPLVSRLLAEYMVSNGTSNPIPAGFFPDRAM
jgi:glycine/D-amino acid oxidase-like deaminating enzyme